MVYRTCEAVILEGNYLLLEAPDWQELHVHWDISVVLNVPDHTLEQRLMERWLKHGLTPEQVKTRACENDLLNASIVTGSSAQADLVYLGPD